MPVFILQFLLLKTLFNKYRLISIAKTIASDYYMNRYRTGRHMPVIITRPKAVEKKGPDLNTIVDKLLDVDREAREILDAAQQYYDKMVEEIDTGKQKILKQYQDKANRHISDVRMVKRAEADEVIQEIRSNYDEIAEALETQYRQNRAQWEQELFARCIGR